MLSHVETFTMGRKRVARAGLVAAALAGRITIREGAVALEMVAPQHQSPRARLVPRKGHFLPDRKEAEGGPLLSRLGLAPPASRSGCDR